MAFVILIEEDPFVRTDMIEALTGAFTNDIVIAYANAEEIEQSHKPELIFADVTADKLQGALATRGWSADGIKCVLTGSQSEEPPANFVRLSRPYTEVMLIRAAKAALGR